MDEPKRDEVWLANLNPTRGREQAGFRQVLVISVDEFNAGPADLAVILPITKVDKNIPLHIEVTPPDGGLDVVSYIMCDQIRTISKKRFNRRLGRVSPETITSIEDRLTILLGLFPN